MYRGRFWTMRQYAGFATAEESNKRYRYLLEQGQTGLSIAFDLPTQIGYDSDDPMAHGEVGKVGWPSTPLADMEVLFQDSPGQGKLLHDHQRPRGSSAGLLYAAAEKQGVPASALKGTIQNDILKEYAARGTYIFPPAPSMRLITNTFEFCSQNVPKWNTISISGYHIREAGSTAAQEIAFTLADGKFLFIITCTCPLPAVACSCLCCCPSSSVHNKEAKINKYTELLEEGLSYFGTFFLGLILGVLCEASTILNPTVIIILVIGILSPAYSAGVGGLLRLARVFAHKAKREDFNPTIGIAGVSCVPTTAKLAQHAAQDENPFAVILPVAMGANISGVITSAIAAGIFVTTIGMV